MVLLAHGVVFQALVALNCHRNWIDVLINALNFFDSSALLRIHHEVIVVIVYFGFFR